MTELAHVGVKGMKWGVRKNRSSGGGGSSHPPRKKPASGDKSTAKKSVKEAKQSTALQTGARIAGKTLKIAGKVAVTGLAAVPVALSAAMWSEWGYSPVDMVNNRPIFEDK